MLLIILKRKRYTIIASVVAVAFASISYYLTVNSIYHKSIFVFAEMNGSLFTIVTLTLGAVIAILLGFHIALLVFRRDIIKSRAMGDKVSSVGGATAGILASGCPSCGAPLLGLVGLPLGLVSLPFKGIELKLLSIILLSLAIFIVTKNIRKNLVCQPH